MTKFGTIRYCPDCGSQLKETGPPGSRVAYVKCPIHHYVTIEFKIDDEIAVKQE